MFYFHETLHLAKHAPEANFNLAKMLYGHLLTSLVRDVFLVFLSISLIVVPKCGTCLYRFQIIAFFLTFNFFLRKFLNLYHLLHEFD